MGVLWWRGIFAGLIAGLVLGLLVKVTSAWSGYQLEIVLFDLSFLPLLGDFNTPPLQWTVHMLTAVVVAWLYQAVVLRVVPNRFRWRVLYGLLTSLIYFGLVPLTVPDLLLNGRAIALWGFDHAVFGAVLGWLSSGIDN